MLEIATRLASIFNGSVQSQTIFSTCKQKLAIRFTCQNEHNFYLTVEQLKSLDLDSIGHQYKSYRSQVHRIQQEQDPYSILSPMPKTCWCNRCVEFYDYCAETINTSQIEIFGGLYTKQILYRCLSKRHVFCVSSLRKCMYMTQYKIQYTSCQKCKFEQREQQKQEQLDKEKRIAEEMAEKQKKLLEQSRIRMERQQVDEERESQKAHSKVQDNIPLQTSLQEQEKQINEKAKKLTREFLSQQSTLDGIGLTFEQAFLIYKFHSTPLHSLIIGFQGKEPDQVKKFFRTVAVKLHPDKNKHPLAKEVFQKLKAAVDQVNQRIDPPPQRSWQGWQPC